MPQPSASLGSADSGSSGGGGKATNSIVIDLSSMGGLASNFFGDSDQTTTLPQRRILVNDTNTNQLAQGFFNPWRRQGYLSAAVATLQATSFVSTPTGVLSSVVYDPVAPQTYWGEHGLGIYSNLNVTGATALNNPQFTLEHTVSTSGISSGQYIQDVEIYTLNGERVLFYSYSGLTSGGAVASNIGVSSLTRGSTWVDGWLSGNNTYNATSVVHPTSLSSLYPLMRLGLGGIMYILDGSFIWGIDGTTTGGAAGTVQNGGVPLLGIAAQDQIVDGIAYRNLFYIACQPGIQNPNTSPSDGSNFQNNCYVEVWNGTILSASNSSVIQDIIPITGIKSIQKLYISPSNTLRMMCVSSNGQGQIREYNGTSFILIQQLGLGSVPMYPDSLVTSDMLTMWAGNDGTIYAHGMVLGQTPEVIAMIGYIVAPGYTPESNIQNVGAILYGSSREYGGASLGLRQDVQTLTMAYKPLSGTSTVVKFLPFDTGSIQLTSISPATSQTALAGDVYSGVHFLASSTASFYTGTRFIAQLSTVGFINVFMAAVPSAYTYITYATIHIYLNGNTTEWGAGSGKAITGADMIKGYKRIEMNAPYVNTVQLKIDFTTSLILGDSSEFHPYQALVYYSPTNARGNAT